MPCVCGGTFVDDYSSQSASFNVAAIIFSLTLLSDDDNDVRDNVAWIPVNL